ncbi:hypothetical protein [uncultured Reyranella sp.]|jgi:hypothetical protein|uniref:bestrophin-like domain n=1 Tax=uncultured Reyranella sp. TaxID=735512 RepID=UPI00259CDB28|nr:hypothetical protein [uncultured Reyranella sp.]
MSLGPFDALFGFLGRLTNGDLHYAGLLVLVVLLVSLETGIWLGRLGARRHVPTEGEKSSVNFATAGMMGLLAFLLGVSLSMASDRYQQRRDSVLAEANAIGTVWLRASVGTGAEGVALQNLLREYTAVRIAVVGGSNTSPPEELLQRTNSLQSEIWALARTVAERSPTPISGLLLTSLNEMIDLSLTNRRNLNAHVPAYILRLLLTVSIFAVGAVGYGFGLVGSRQHVLSILLLGIWTLAIVLIIDIDRPQSGEVRIDPAPLVWTLQGFGPAK